MTKFSDLAWAGAQGAVARSPFVPRGGCEMPPPGRKRSELAKDALPEGDPALHPNATVP